MNLKNDIKEYMKDWLYHYIDEYCIDRKDLRDTTIKHPYSYMFYMRNGLLNQTFLTYTGYLFWDEYAKKYKENPFQLAGLETAATPLLIGLIMTAAAFDINGLNSFIIRKTPKTYGKKQRFEGKLIKELPVLLVDDFCNSGNSLKTAKRYIEQENLNIYDSAFVVVASDFDDFKLNHIHHKDDFYCTFQDYELNKAYEKNIQKPLNELYKED